MSDLDAVDGVMALLLTDAQTSGGLLVALPPESAEGFVDAVAGSAVIGRFTAEPVDRVVVR